MVKLRSADLKSLGELIPKKLQKIPGITRTVTLLTYFTISKEPIQRIKYIVSHLSSFLYYASYEHRSKKSF